MAREVGEKYLEKYLENQKTLGKMFRGVQRVSVSHLRARVQN